MNVPAYVEFICCKLRSLGYQAWVVGGAVRDSLMGRRPDDWDIATDALPDGIASMFEHTVLTGAKQSGSDASS